MTQDRQNNGSMPGGCPDDELLAAYLDGGLDNSQRQAVEAHLDSCDECRLMLGLAFQSQEEHSAAYSQEMMDQAAALARPGSAQVKAAPKNQLSLWDRLWAWFSPPRFALGAAAVIVTVLVIGVFDPDQPSYMAKTDVQTPVQQAPAEAEPRVAPMMVQEAAPPSGARNTATDTAAAPAMVAKAPAPAKREKPKGVPPQPKARKVFRYEQPSAAATRMDEVRLGPAAQSRAPLSRTPMVSAMAPRMKVASLSYYKLRTSRAADFGFDYLSPAQMSQALSDNKYEVVLADITLLGGPPKGWQTMPIARYPLAVVVNKANPLKGLTMEQLRNIYSGKAANWLELGGTNLPIEALTLPECTYAARLWTQLIGTNQGGASMVPRLELMHYVAQAPAAIGYVPMGQIMGMTDTKALTVDGVSPLVSSGGYNKDYKFGGQVAVLYRPNKQAEAQKLAQSLKLKPDR